MTQIYTTAMGDLLAQECKSDTVRTIEQGGDWRPLWATLEGSGFADALVPENDGGAGLSLYELFGVFERCGHHALPLPFAETVLARALLSAAGLAQDARPSGPIALARGWRHAGGLRCDSVPCARSASAVLVHDGSAWLLLDPAFAQAREAGFVLDLALDWPVEAIDAVPLSLPETLVTLRVETLQACANAALLAGAAGRVLDMTLAYANQRVQFGRVIGKFQAVQHHLAVMAEHVAAARAAAEIGCLSPRTLPDALPAALAMARCGEAALAVAGLGHQVHGAIGFTDEFELQLLTRRLHAWRRAGGAESRWYEAVGRTLVDEHRGTALELIVDTLSQLPETIE